MLMANKKPKTTIEETTEELTPVELSEMSPEQIMMIQSGGLQTVLNLGLFEELYLEDVRDRIFYLDSEVKSDVLHTIISQILRINGMEYGNPNPEDIAPIIIIINSCGGSVPDGLALCDAINTSRVPVIGIVTGYAYSMAFSILTQCHMRVGMPNSSYLFHDGWTCDSNTSSKVRDAARFYEQVDKRINKMIANRTKFTTEYLESISRADNYWLADEMKEKGVLDAIIGEDIDIGEIFSFMSEHRTECECDECSEK